MTSILVIDDDTLIREATTLLLREVGYHVLCAADGCAGEAVLSRNDVDIVITDILMPKQDGLKTIMSIRRSNPLISIIAMSGSQKNTDIDYLRHAKHLGATHVLEKPFTASQLLAKVFNCIDTMNVGSEVMVH